LNDHTWVSELGELARISRLSIAALACCVALVPSLAAAKTYRSLEIKHEFQRQHPGPSTGISYVMLFRQKLLDGLPIIFREPGVRDQFNHTYKERVAIAGA
jgi:hypothetical protein